MEICDGRFGEDFLTLPCEYISIVCKRIEDFSSII